jgi:hypothetical protein
MSNATPIKISITFITEIEKSTLNFIWKQGDHKYARKYSGKRTILEVSQYPTSNHITKQ